MHRLWVPYAVGTGAVTRKTGGFNLLGHTVILPIMHREAFFNSAGPVIRPKRMVNIE